MRTHTLLSIAFVLSACSAAPAAVEDGGPLADSSSTECTSDVECDDGLFCSGTERCVPGAADADARGCVPGTWPCEGGIACSEATETCGGECPDADNDGHTDAACGGDDCDDADERRYPGNIELCDLEGLDEDCDPSTFGDDADSDRYVSERCCQIVASGRTECGADCNDESAAINPEAVDNCGGGDQDCDGVTDENADVTFYRDVDGDGHGVVTDTLVACSAPAGYAVIAGDCDDTLGGVNPGVPEACNLRDDNCDGTIDEGCACAPEGRSDMCGASAVGSCRMGTRTCVAGEWSSCAGAIGPATEVCEGSFDENCDGVVDEGCECIGGETRTCGMTLGICRSVTQACSSGRWPRECSEEPGVMTERAETCDGSLDEDCDGATDEGCTCTNGTVDRLGCGTDVGECEYGMRRCTAGAWGACSGGVDSRDEVCEGSSDENCNGSIDEGCACTTGQTQPCGLGACLGMRTCASGVWGTCSGAMSSPETCNGIDDDCDGVVDDMVPGVGGACGTDVGLCTRGTYVCSGTLTCTGGVQSSAEVCDHRDQDCDGRLDEGTGAASCTWSQSASPGTSFRAEFQCSHGTCGTNSAGEIDSLTVAASSEPRVASLRLAPGTVAPDWGERFSAHATFDVRRYNSVLGVAQGPIGVFIAPSTTPSSGGAEQGLPRLTGSQYGFAALYQTFPGRHQVEIWEMTPGGSHLRATGSALGSACENDDDTFRRFTIRLDSNAGTITALLSGPSCGTSLATFVDADWQTRVYGADESSPFPVYEVGAIAWNAHNLQADLQSFAVIRTRTSTRPNCDGCPW